MLNVHKKIYNLSFPTEKNGNFLNEAMKNAF